MTAGRSVLGGVVAVAATAGVVALSNLPYAVAPGEEGELRLAWRWPSERVEQCRRLSAAEQAKLPAHMRRTVECRRGLRPYLLEVLVDGRRLAYDSVLARGAGSDRPLAVFRRLPLTRGRHTVRVVFSPVTAPAGPGVDPDDSEDAEAPDQAEGSAAAPDHRGARATPVAGSLVIEAPVVVAPRQVVLITVDAERNVLVMRTR